MDADFEQHYQAAERAYGLEEYAKAQAQEPAGTKLLENSWLRVQLQLDIKNPTDCGEPMGLINRIKGVFVRSAGR